MKIQMGLIINMLRSDGSIVVNKKLASAIGLQEAIFYSELLSKFAYFQERNQLTQDGYFFNTVEDMEISTTLSKYQQSSVIKKLKELKMIDCKLKGVPATRYFKILDASDLLLEILQTKDLQQKSRNYLTRSQETEQQEVKKLDSKKSRNCTEIILNNNTNNNLEKEEEELHANKEIVMAFKENIGDLKPMEADILFYYKNDLNMDSEVIIEAIRKSVLSGARNVRYIEKTLQDWHRKNLLTIEALQRYLKDYENEKGKKNFKKSKEEVENGHGKDNAKKSSSFEGIKVKSYLPEGAKESDYDDLL